jgi:L-asparaginase II/ribosomal protein S18 acetylase RimI-like enzyme
MHRGAIAVVDVEGTILGGVGDPRVQVVLRSAAKPFQAAALVESGAADAFSVTDEELAVMSASHAGTPEHVRVVRRLLDRAGSTAVSLVCGSLEHMCSGKHAGMILLARHLGVSAEGYEREDHPVQQHIAEYVGSVLQTRPRRPFDRLDVAGAGSLPLFAGADGCGVPVVGTSLHEAAWLYASLAAGTTPALRRVRDAMMAHPTAVAGEARFDTVLMRAAPGRVIAKGGAEGVQGAGLMFSGEGQGGSAGLSGHLGCLIKIEDGSARSIPSLVALLLRSWGMAETAGAVEECFSPVLRDCRGVEVGRVEVLVEEAALARRSTSATPGQKTAAAGGGAGGFPARPAERVPAGLHLFGRRDGRVTVCRGDEREVLRFLREQWPAVDEQYFGRTVEWSAEPYSLVFRRDGKIVAVLKGHFVGGMGSVDELMVAAGSRGGGLGSLLLDSFEDEARRRGCTQVLLRAVKGSAAEDFYRGRGYHRECVQYGYEFGYDYVRLACDIRQIPEETKGREQKGDGTR